VGVGLSCSSLHGPYVAITQRLNVLRVLALPSEQLTERTGQSGGIYCTHDHAEVGVLVGCVWGLGCADIVCTDQHSPATA
jgi:hypothetical protein